MVLILIFLVYACSNSGEVSNISEKLLSKDTFKIISSTSTRAMDDELISYAKKKGFDVEIEHSGDLEIVDILNDDSSNYDDSSSSSDWWSLRRACPCHMGCGTCHHATLRQDIHRYGTSHLSGPVNHSYSTGPNT